MLFPINTDAPVYYYPVMTIVLIVVNFCCFLLTGMGSLETVDVWGPWSLQHGQGLHPLQWITSNFIHMGFMHLFGNMVFLWGFGLVVEGKLGWWRFLAVYLGIGIAQCAVEQTLMLWSDASRGLEMTAEEMEELQANGVAPEEMAELIGANAAEWMPGSFGASAIVFGMLAMSLVWAPKNEMTCLMFFGFRSFTFEITIMTFALWYIGWEVLIAALQGFAIQTATLHVMGAAVGFGLGTLMLKRHWVDCEDWDLFAVMSGHYGPYARDTYGNRIDRDGKQKQDDWIKTGKPKSPKKKRSAGSETLTRRKLDEIQALIDAGDFQTANDELYNLRLKDSKARLTAEPLKALAIGLFKQSRWEDAIPLLEEHIEQYPETADGMRLRLAHAQLEGRNDVQTALKTLKSIRQNALSDNQRSMFQKLMKRAREAA